MEASGTRRAGLAQSLGGYLYLAYRGDILIAEAPSLEELAEKLRELGVPPRGLRIVREPSGEEGKERRLGFRIREAEARS